MESPSSTVRRRAWIHSSLQCHTLEDLEEPLCNLLPSVADDDDVFSDGCSPGKIEHWLLGCGLEACAKNSGHLSIEPMLRAINSFEDDLTLGADASALHFGNLRSEVGLPPPPPPPATAPHAGLISSTPRQNLSLPALNLGHSMTSSCPSNISKTTSIVSEVLQMCSEDAEETLYQLGFGCDEPQVTARIPARFLTFPSQVEGINLRLFLESQLRRIREEDPSLSLASRFRQVEVLTAMANAFYSLYSHVSRTPLQKLAPPEFSLSPSPGEKIKRFRSSIRSEPRSPVERLKHTVSKMCLYTGSPRGSDSTSPQTSPRKRSSIPDVGGLDSETSKEPDLGDHNVTFSTVDSGKGCNDELEAAVGGGSKHTDVAETDGNVLSSITASLPEMDHHLVSDATRDLIPVATFTYDAICPQTADSHGSPHISSHSPDRSRAASHRRHTSGGTANKGASGSLPHPDPYSTYSSYRTASGWEADGVSSCSSNAPPDSIHSPAARHVQTREQSQGEHRYLHLLKHQTLRHITRNLQPVNSFELEEVHSSAGEEDYGQLETTRTTVPTSREHQCKGPVVRGDSVQSDSSGYADEEVGPSTDVGDDRKHGAPHPHGALR